jgi:hypothetical protein
VIMQDRGQRGKGAKEVAETSQWTKACAVSFTADSHSASQLLQSSICANIRLRPIIRWGVRGEVPQCSSARMLF